MRKIFFVFFICGLFILPQPFLFAQEENDTTEVNEDFDEFDFDDFEVDFSFHKHPTIGVNYGLAKLSHKDRKSVV